MKGEIRTINFAHYAVGGLMLVGFLVFLQRFLDINFYLMGGIIIFLILLYLVSLTIPTLRKYVPISLITGFFAAIISLILFIVLVFIEIAIHPPSEE